MILDFTKLINMIVPEGNHNTEDKIPIMCWFNQGIF